MVAICIRDKTDPVKFMYLKKNRANNPKEKKFKK